MSNSRHNKGVDDFRQTLAALIRQNDERGSKFPDGNPASRSLHSQHLPAHPNPHADHRKPTIPGQVARSPHPAAPPPQSRHPATRARMPNKPPVDRDEMFQRRIASAMAQRSHSSSAGDGTMVQASMFAGGLVLACCATFVLVYHFVSDDTVTSASSHFQAPTTAQATLGVSSPEVSSSTPGSNHVATANAKALTDIANGNWVVLPSDVNGQVQPESSASVRQQTAGRQPTGSAATRQQLFESFQTYLQETGRARVTDNPDQEALFNSFVRWNVEVANAN